MRATDRPDRRGAGKKLAGAPRSLGVALPGALRTPPASPRAPPAAAGARRWRWLGAPGRMLPALAVLLAVAGVAADDRIGVSHAALLVRHGPDPGAYVDAQFELQLPPSLRDAVDHGIALYFAIEVEVTRSRWYWFDKRVVDDAIEYRLSFSPLTREYRLARGGLAQPFESLDQALATLRHVAQWRVADAAALEGGNTRARIRLRLDTSMLPKPFQVSALTDRDWTLVSDWAPVPVSGDGSGN